MKKFLLLALLSIPAVWAQVPNCQINIGPWTDLNTSQAFFNGGSTQCAYFVITYQVTGFSAISLQFESATGTQGSPGSFGAFSGTVETGSNPSTSVSCGTPSNCTATFSGVVGWFRVRLVSKTGNGVIQGTLQGYKGYIPLGGNVPSGSGCAGTAGTPCIVAGPDAVGAAPTKNPVQVAGNDGTNTRAVRTDTTGRSVVVGAAASGAALAGNPVTVCGSDGTNCTPIKTDASGDVQTAFVGLGTFNAGQQAVTGSAVALATHTARAVCLVALAANTIPIYVGPTGVTTSTGLELSPGQGTCQPVSNSNLIFVVASTTGASVSWSLVN